MRDLLICLCLAIATAAVYWPVRHFDFVDFDDKEYVYGNPRVAGGLTRENIAWSVQSFGVANYHPLTLLSLQLDATLFGLNAGAFHVENVLLHILATLLLYAVLRRATGEVWPVAFVAGVFALHPTHVESVAWISERKDVLCICFMLAAMWAYLWYAQRGISRTRRRAAYVVILSCFALGLLAKSMIVTFPFLLLLMDCWPLRRIASSGNNRWRVIGWRTALIEKLPLLLMSAVASVLAAVAQNRSGAVATLRGAPLESRLQNISVAYARYLGKTFWPVDLAAFYPFQIGWPASAVAASLLSLLVVTIAVLAMRRRWPQLLVGWLWFVGTLVPVIGIVQVGAQSMADRYLYLPMVGLTFMIAWPARGLLDRFKPALADIMAALVGVAVLSVCAIVARHQVWYWRDTRALMEHSLMVINGNAVAHVKLGVADAREGRTGPAAEHYEQAIRSDPQNVAAEFNYGNLLLERRPQDAVAHYARAAKLEPDNDLVQNNWGIALMKLDRPGEAFEHFRAAAQLAPDAFDPHYNLGQLLFAAGQFSAARSEFQRAVRLDPRHTGAQRGLEAASRSAAP